MLLFLDEAWDTWFKFNNASSKYFTIGLTIFEDNEEASNCDKKISLLREELSLKKNYEFHYKKDPNRVKTAFMQAVSVYDFFYYGIVVDKENLYSENLRHKESFYKYICSLVFQNAKEHLHNAIVVIDRQWWKKFEQQLQTYLKRKMNDSYTRIKKVKMQDSHRNNLIQLADYIASWIHREVSRPTKETVMKYINHRKISIQIRPKQKTTSIR